MYFVHKCYMNLYFYDCFVTALRQRLTVKCRFEIVAVQPTSVSHVDMHPTILSLRGGGSGKGWKFDILTKRP